MEGTKGPKFCLAAVVLLAVLQYRSLAQDDAPSLCYTFSVSASGPRWCEFLGTISGTPLFKYSCESREAKPIGPLGMMPNATEAWNQQSGHCTDLVEELQKALLDNKQNLYKAFGTDPLSLQVHMMCQQESNGCPSAFCHFNISGQECLRFHLKEKSWTELHSGCRSLKETLESERHMANLLVLVSRGDFVKLVNESAVLDPKASPTLASVRTPVPATSKAVIIRPNNLVLILTLIYILITHVI